ncbi:MAG: aminotransferase class I/II-fold pyridoxal phosphate-dependent enzyme [Bacteroidales bacterium]|nr:aminotransferase class I/II-fold pyridoxal phosphate-dependent enzyme [Bacteroidales bacterium]MDD2425234.1 aminotransferase class I/II-fold pyridoxal phosphate-dependent enzyme [Bacteroidales bacterium]MDD3988923.1 aminotransferase class I/II-fold pyridoxal phosphate-dependent enzyme [Bacteroidales bacterium]MDD4639595.1 aminotransferase class I/II-fold pyridoxal phosphate-dependent enzyme [Bacteroidales bacterium]
MKHSFGSDNHSGVAPEILEAIIDANNGFDIAYGEDQATKSLKELFKTLLGSNAEAYPVFNGTGANIVALKAMTQPFNAILCPATAHINVDECGAPERLTGCKLISLEHKDGKVSVETVKKELKEFGVQHHSQVKVLSISQPTELGTLYTPDEISELATLMHSFGCYLHIDGSRISNAAAALKLPVKEFTADCGVDALSFGGTKNGLLIGEVVVLFREELNTNFMFIRKQAAQLFSKCRFISVQFQAFLKNELNIRLAAHSNAMAKYLEHSLTMVPEVEISRPVETNVVFARISKELCAALQKLHYFYIWDESTMEVRWMCSFNTTREDIDRFVYDIKKLLTKQL